VSNNHDMSHYRHSNRLNRVIKSVKAAWMHVVDRYGEYAHRNLWSLDVTRRRSLRRLRPFTVAGFSTKQKPVTVTVCDSLLPNNTNLHPMLRHFPVIAQYWSNYWNLYLFNAFVLCNLCTVAIGLNHVAYCQKLHSLRYIADSMGLTRAGLTIREGAYLFSYAYSQDFLCFLRGCTFLPSPEKNLTTFLSRRRYV